MKWAKTKIIRADATQGKLIVDLATCSDESERLWKAVNFDEADADSLITNHESLQFI
jgi:hypothetical protein